MEGRTQKSIKNITVAVMGQIAVTLISFLSRRVFLNYLDLQYLGLNGLFSNILTLLSIVELGIGPALAFSLYKPLAVGDVSKIKSLMNLYKKAYSAIGAIILFLGLIMLFFYKLSINMSEVPSELGGFKLDLIFYLFVINTGISYFYSYKRSLLICDQKQYITNIYHYSAIFLLQVVQIIALALTKNQADYNAFLLFLICQIIFTWLENLVISMRADKLYPYLKDKNIRPLDKNEFGGIKKNVGAMIIHKIGGAIVVATPTIFLSKMISLDSVGLYNNYYLLISALQSVLNQLFGAVVAGIGDLNASADHAKLKIVHNRIFFVNFWIFGFCSITLMCLFNQFITLWLDDKSLLFTTPVVLVIVLSFFITGMRKTLLTFKEATGTFWNDRYRPIFELIINIAASYFLGLKFGIAGIFAGTIVSTITTSWIEPYVVYKHVLHERLWKFFARYAVYFAAVVIAYFATYFLLLKPETPTIMTLVCNAVICAAVPNILFLAAFFKTPEFKYFFNLIIKRKID